MWLNLPGFLLNDGVFLISAVPAMGSKTCLEQSLWIDGVYFYSRKVYKEAFDLMADTGKGAQAWHVEHQPSDKGTVAHL